VTIQTKLLNIPTIIDESRGGRDFHKSPELLPLRVEKGSPFKRAFSSFSSLNISGKLLPERRPSAIAFNPIGEQEYGRLPVPLE
jgi:hypothetical protein